MKILCAMAFPLFLSSAWANTWSRQVNINGNRGPVKQLERAKSSFEAGPYYCEVTPVNEANGTEFRTLVCSVGSGTVSTGGLCTKRGAKSASLQYAILNLNGPKNLVNVVVSCKFD